MKRATLLFTLAFAAISACAQTNPNITAAYAGMKFQVPGSPVIVGSLGVNNDILLIKYSNNIGERYISFGTENTFETGGCEWSDFFEATLSDTAKYNCSPASVASFRHVFIEGAETGVWKIAGKAYYYFLSDSDSSFVFFESSDGNLIKLESDFLDSDGFRQVLGAL